MNAQTISFLSHVTNALVISSNLGRRRLQETREKFQDDPEVLRALDILEKTLDEVLKGTTSLESLDVQTQVAELLENNPYVEAHIMASLIRWSVRNHESRTKRIQRKL